MKHVPYDDYRYNNDDLADRLAYVPERVHDNLVAAIEDAADTYAPNMEAREMYVEVVKIDLGFYDANQN